MQASGIPGYKTEVISPIPMDGTLGRVCNTHRKKGTGDSVSGEAGKDPNLNKIVEVDVGGEVRFSKIQDVSNERFIDICGS